MFSDRSTPRRLPMPGALFLAVCFALISALAPAPAGAQWPEIPRSDWQLVSVPEAPSASAVVLHRQGHLVFTERAVSSYLEIYERTKILKEEGLDYGSISLPSSRFYRMKGLQARTLQGDGQASNIGKEDKFEKKFSVIYKAEVHSLAMPDVKVGSIIEVRYKVFFDSFLYTLPWYFQDRLPVLRSEIICEFPTNIGMQPYRVVTVKREIEESAERSPIGHRLTYAMSNLPPVPDEASSFPFEDMASRVVFLTQAVVLSGQRIPVLENWRSVIETYEDLIYKEFRRGSRDCKKLGASLATGKASPREKIEAVYRYVQDEIDTDYLPDISVFDDRTCDKALKAGRAYTAEKGLMLEQMLKGAKISSVLGWTASRYSGRIVQQVPQPGQLERVLVAVELDGERVFLDAAGQDNPVGHLQAGLEGVPVLLLSKKDGEWAMTPKSPAAASTRLARLDLAVTEDGAVEGSGTLLLEGHHAWRRIGWKENTEETREAWQQWLEGRLEGFDVSEVSVEERGRKLQVEVGFRLVQREEEVLGDEVSLPLAMLLGVSDNPFNLPPGQRQTPVQMAFADRDRVELKLAWPEGWEIDAAPKLRAIANGAGRLETELQGNKTQRTLTAVRTFEVADSEYIGAGPYSQLHQLYEQALANDAERVVLVLN